MHENYDLHDLENNWKQYLIDEVSQSSGVEVAKRLGVSCSMIYQAVNPGYPERDTAVKWLFLSAKIGADLNGDWMPKLRVLCNKFTVTQVANFFGTSTNCISLLLKGEYKSNALKIKGLVLFKYDQALDKLLPLPKHCKKYKRHNKKQSILKIIDVIFVQDKCTIESLVDATGFFKAYVTKVLQNLLSANAVEETIVLVPHKLGRTKIEKTFKLVCGCAAPGLTESCKNCPLGKLMMSLEGELQEEDDEEELDYAC